MLARTLRGNEAGKYNAAESFPEHPGKDLGIRARVWASWLGFGRQEWDSCFIVRISASGLGIRHPTALRYQ